MEHLIKSLPAIMRAAANSGEVTEAACIAAWNHAVGEGLRNNAIPIEFRDRRLIVAVADRIWQRQLQTMLGQLLYRLNAVLG
ncbi:MAG: DciA family protein, partial [Pyrinomonadaceae bacterium]